MKNPPQFSFLLKHQLKFYKEMTKLLITEIYIHFEEKLFKFIETKFQLIHM